MDPGLDPDLDDLPEVLTALIVLGFVLLLGGLYWALALVPAPHDLQGILA